MPRARSLNDVIERRRREREVGGDRYVDLRIDFEPEAGGPIALTAGARWDRRSGFDGKARNRVVVRYHTGQARAVEWFSRWLDRHEQRRDVELALLDQDATKIVELDEEVDPTEVYSALFAGGRRGGKSFIAVALAVAYAVRFPSSLVWLVSPSNERHDELRRYVAEFVPGEWLDGETQEGWEICNGSRLLLKSAYGSGDQLKEGKANLVVLNEGQKMAERAYVVSRGAIVDSAGLVLVCANPPVEMKDQQWVSNFAADASAHRRASVYVHFNPLLNPHIDRKALLALEREVDGRTYAIEVLGHFLPSRDAVAYNWIRLENELHKPADLHDCTSRFLELAGEGAGFRQVVGLDVQRFPYIGGPVYRFFGTPDPDHVLMWAVDEVVLEGGDEVDFCGVLLDKGFLPEETLIVCDASGQYQHSRRRSADAPPPEWKGRGSFDIIRGEGYRRIVPPDRRQRRNPEIVDRARAFTSLICTGAGERRLFADPDLAPKTCAAIREWKTTNGTPSRTQDVAHMGDGASYPVVRFFPRRLRSGRKSSNPRSVPTLTDKIDLQPMPSASRASDLRISPPSRGSSLPRRGKRTAGF